MTKFYKIILIFFSILNIFKVKFNKIKCANYFIVKNNLEILDKRSLNFFDLKTCNYSFNLIRTHKLNFKTLINILKIPNFFCFSIIKVLIFNKLKSKSFMNLISYIFIFLKIKRLILIDDYREMKFFSSLSKNLNLSSLIYMHGRLSKNSVIHKKTKFDIFFVWSNFFKKQLLETSQFYKSENIKVIGNPNFKKKIFLKKRLITIKRCLILDEDFINYTDIKKFLFEISKNKSIEFFFKKKISRNIPKKILFFLKKNKIKIIEDAVSFEKAISKYKIDAIIASTSTGLLEAAYYDVIPIKIFSGNKKRENEFKVFLDNGMIYSAKSPKMLTNQLHRKFSYKERLKSKNLLWGNSIYNVKKVKSKVKKFILN